MTTEEKLAVLEDFLANVDMSEGVLSAGRVLGGIHLYLSAEGLKFESLRPILQLRSAFADHQDGKPNPLLAVIKRKGNRLHVADENFKLYAVAIMTLLQRTGSKRNDAAAAVAKRLRSAGIEVTEQSIDGWHREIVSRDDRDMDLWNAYHDLVGKLARGPDVRARAHRMLDHLPSMPREKL